MKLLNKLKIIFIASLLISCACTFLCFGCSTGTPSGDTVKFPDKATVKTETNTKLCYLEDFGQGEIYKATTFQEKDIADKSYQTKLETEKIEKKVYFSNVTIPDGKCKLFYEGQELGVSDIAQGKIVIENVPANLKLGKTYDLEVLTTQTLYKLKFKYVSKAIYDKEDLVVALTYYKSNSGDKEESKSPSNIERAKFYDGQTFSKRLYVLANDVSYTVDDVLWGVGGENQLQIPTRWLKEQTTSYFYDDFDGQGNCVRFDNLYAGGMFGRVGAGATIKNLCIESRDTYWTGCGNTHDGKSFIGQSVAGNCVLENLAIRLEDTRSAHKLNLIAPYISETVKLKDIYIYNAMALYEADTVTSSDCKLIDADCGYLGYNCKTTDITNVVVVSEKLRFASRIKDEETNTFKVLCAENQTEFDNEIDYEVEYLYGCNFYSFVSEMGNNIVGNWQILDSGKAIYLR